MEPQVVLTSYRLIYAEGSESMNDLVNQALDSGWELYGNPMMGVTPDGSTALYQAMVFKETIDPLVVPIEPETEKVP